MTRQVQTQKTLQRKTDQTERRRQLSRWRPILLLDAYVAAKQGATNEEIAKACDISWSCLKDRWLPTKPELREAIERGRAEAKKKPTESFKDYMEERLSPKMKALYEEITYWTDHAEGPEKIEALLQPHGDKVRQNLWLHAMIESNFDAGAACKVVNISKRTIQRWTDEDPDFPALLDEINWHKQNFFENALIGLATMRDSKAVIHANKTLNRNRGYGERLDIKMSGSVTHQHVVIPVDKLNLPLETLMQIEAAMTGLPDMEGMQTATPVKALAIGKENESDEEDEDD